MVIKSTGELMEEGGLTQCTPRPDAGVEEKLMNGEGGCFGRKAQNANRGKVPYPLMGTFLMGKGEKGRRSREKRGRGGGSFSKRWRRFWRRVNAQGRGPGGNGDPVWSGWDKLEEIAVVR